MVKLQHIQIKYLCYQKMIKYKYNETYPQEFLYNIYNNCKGIISIDTNNYIKQCILYIIVEFLMNNNDK